MTWSDDSYTFIDPLVLVLAFDQTLPSSTHLHQSSTEFRCQTCKLRMGISSCGAPMGIQWWFKNLQLQIQLGVAHLTTRIAFIFRIGDPYKPCTNKYTYNWVTIELLSSSTSKKWLVPFLWMWLIESETFNKGPQGLPRTGHPARQPRKFWHL